MFFSGARQDPIKEVSTLQLLHNGNEGRPGGHAGVEELVEALVDDTNLYKISVWYDGGELFERCPMPERDAKGVFAQILDALKFVHAQGGACVLALNVRPPRHPSFR